MALMRSVFSYRCFFSSDLIPPGLYFFEIFRKFLLIFRTLINISAIIGKISNNGVFIKRFVGKELLKMTEKVCFTTLETDEKLNYLYEEMRGLAKRQDQMMGDLEYIGKQLRRVEIIQDDNIADSIAAMVSNFSDISKKMDRFVNMEAVLHTIKSDVKIIKEL